MLGSSGCAEWRYQIIEETEPAVEHIYELLERVHFILGERLPIRTQDRRRRTCYGDVGEDLAVDPDRIGIAFIRGRADDADASVRAAGENADRSRPGIEVQGHRRFEPEAALRHQEDVRERELLVG